MKGEKDKKNLLKQVKDHEHILTFDQLFEKIRKRNEMPFFLEVLRRKIEFSDKPDEIIKSIAHSNKMKCKALAAECFIRL